MEKLKKVDDEKREEKYEYVYIMKAYKKLGYFISKCGFDSKDLTLTDGEETLVIDGKLLYSLVQHLFNKDPLFKIIVNSDVYDAEWVLKQQAEEDNG